MRKRVRKKRIAPRIPIGAVTRLGSHPVTTKKGEKGYDRERSREETQRMVQEESLPET